MNKDDIWSSFLLVQCRIVAEWMLVTNTSSNDESAARYIGHKRSHRRGGGFKWRLFDFQRRLLQMAFAPKAVVLMAVAPMSVASMAVVPMTVGPKAIARNGWPMDNRHILIFKWRNFRILKTHFIKIFLYIQI